MKGRMSIKSILGMTILVIFSFMFLNMSLAASTAKIVVETANIRQTPSTSSTILDQVFLNNEVEVLEQQNEWTKVKAGNVTGYIKTSLLEIQNITNEKEVETNIEETTNEDAKKSEDTSEETEQSSVDNNDANKIVNNITSDKNLESYYSIDTVYLKSVPLINATNIKELSNETQMQPIKFSNGWIYVICDGQKGWVRESQAKSQTQLDLEREEARRQAEIEAQKARLQALLNAPVIKTVYVKVDALNLRKDPALDAEVITTFYKNNALSVIGTENNMYQIRSGESIGYVSTQYVSDTKIETTSSRAAVSRSTTTSQTTANPVPAATGIVGIAQQYLGIPYLYGGTSPATGFDCSGFTQYVYAQAGISIPRTTGGQATVGTRVSYENALPGDLVIYPGHAAIYVGNGQVIHSPRTGQSIKYASINTAGNGGYQIRRVS